MGNSFIYFYINDQMREKFMFRDDWKRKTKWGARQTRSIILPTHWSAARKTRNTSSSPPIIPIFSPSFKLFA